MYNTVLLLGYGEIFEFPVTLISIEDVIKATLRKAPYKVIQSLTHKK